MMRNVAVLMGGWSAEREVSLVSGAAVANGLKAGGYSVTSIDVQRDMGALLTRLYPKPDAVFNALHGRYGEDGNVQGLLNILDIPYTHSGLLASALAMDKPAAKSLFAAAGILVAAHVIASRDDLASGPVMEAPYVIKPLNEGSSVGVTIIGEGERYSADGESWPYGEKVMVERFIAGRELTVAVMGDKALAVTEITTQRGFYDYDAKYAEGGSQHRLPADIPAPVEAEAMRISALAHKELGCRGVSRADIRFDGKDLYILEVNTQPGMTPTSLVPEQAAHAGIPFPELVGWMVENAACD
ncbi:MAG: D-alanine--D-alanine ligase [Rhodospirillaceae bacterium]|jgi:D-alanine-D-alanine ligase|nr:D-alanine--D-alanine ligase [Rhodospirillaceae bacterium]MBT3887516.1 D-alanine--D-alanine ligase [Rhodospirillaceae bacterium]MBT4118638.1 D-alanine--D-alanine ligase [Rhodospirillaceae bacterium]MBT4671838.1 D-alanine--D-alanine ligase [Rhodospirillaceae bacterium]MBT4719274.1 D-alanine--D-alanine ligase [Rhodospirillaceae bacterium]